MVKGMQSLKFNENLSDLGRNCRLQNAWLFKAATGENVAGNCSLFVQHPEIVAQLAP